MPPINKNCNCLWFLMLSSCGIFLLITSPEVLSLCSHSSSVAHGGKIHFVNLFIGWSVYHFGLDRNISINMEWTLMKCFADTHPQQMNPAFREPRLFKLCHQDFFFSKISQILLMDIVMDIGAAINCPDDK